MIQLPAADGGSREGHAAPAIPIGRLAGQPLLLMFDVDGTLAPIAEHPSLARVPDETRRLIAWLVTRPGVTVALVSGRAAHDARRMVGVENVWTIGNHGAELMTPDGEISVDPETAGYAQQMARAAHTLQPLLAPLRGVLLENKGWTLSVHYRMADDALLPRLRGAVDGVASQIGLRVTDGKKVLEIRPPVRIDKGIAIDRLATSLGARHASASLLFAGDDATDEDAFRRLRHEWPNAVTVCVGTTDRTAAEFVLASPDDVRELLQRIARDHDSKR